jgi:hypothetical protein
MVKAMQIDNRERGMALENRGAPVARAKDASALLEEVRRDPPHDAKAECPVCYQQGVDETIKSVGEAEDIEVRVLEILETPLVPRHLHVGASFRKGSKAVLDAIQGGTE